MSDYINYANDHPWIFICFIMCISIWRILKYLGVRLFDENKGLLPMFVRNIQEDSRVSKLSIAESREHASKMFEDNMKHSNLIEERIIKKIDVSTDEVKYLIGEINKDK